MQGNLSVEFFFLLSARGVLSADARSAAACDPRCFGGLGVSSVRRGNRFWGAAPRNTCAVHILLYLGVFVPASPGSLVQKGFGGRRISFLLRPSVGVGTTQLFFGSFRCSTFMPRASSVCFECVKVPSKSRSFEPFLTTPSPSLIVTS